MNKDVNKMSKWDFECALKEYERQNQKLQELQEAMEEPMHFHNAASVVCMSL